MPKNETKPETTKEVKPETTEVEMVPVITKWANKTNDAVDGIRKADGKLFDVVRGAYLELSTKTSDLELYKDKVNIDRSTFNKIISVVRNTTLTKFSKDLPVSWNTLYSISKMSAEHLADAIKTEKIHVRSTLADVNNVRKKYEGTKDTDSGAKPDLLEKNLLWVDLDELRISEDEVVEVLQMLKRLNFIGIKITGVDLVDSLDAIDRLAA